MLTRELFNRYVRARGAFLYHLTDAENVDSILAHGLVPGIGEPRFAPTLTRPGHVYLCNRITALRSLWGHFVCSWGDVVLRVDLRLLEPSRFNTDEEYWRDFEYPDGTVVGPDWLTLRSAFPHMDEPPEVYQCLWDSGCVAYSDRIAPDALTVWQFHRRHESARRRKRVRTTQSRS